MGLFSLTNEAPQPRWFQGPMPAQPSKRSSLGDVTDKFKFVVSEFFKSLGNFLLDFFANGPKSPRQIQHLGLGVANDPAWKREEARIAKEEVLTSDT